MRTKLVLIPAVSLCLLVWAQAGPAASADSRCSLPTGLREEIKQKYSAAKVVDLGDLSDDDRRLFQKDHGDRCPGMISVDFYGDGHPTWALVLTTGEGQKQKADLIVGHQIGAGWEIASLDTANESVPVVWRQPPGEYHDVYGEKTLRARHPVIVFVGYNAWGIVYAWNGKRVEKVWLSD